MESVAECRLASEPWISSAVLDGVRSEAGDGCMTNAASLSTYIFFSSTA